MKIRNDWFVIKFERIVLLLFLLFKYLLLFSLSSKLTEKILIHNKRKVLGTGILAEKK